MDRDGGVEIRLKTADKKLKQGRLPFKALDPKIVKTPSPVSNSKKRKLSGGTPNSGNKVLKTPRNDEPAENKKNSPILIDLCDNEVSSSSETDNVKENIKKPPCGSIIKCFELLQQREVSTSSNSSKSSVAGTNTDLVHETSNTTADSTNDNEEVTNLNLQNESSNDISLEENDGSTNNVSDIENENDSVNISKGIISDNSICDSPGTNKSCSTPISKNVDSKSNKGSEKKKTDKPKLELNMKKQAAKEAKEKERLEKERIRKEKEQQKKEEKEKKEKERLEKEEEKIKAKQLENDLRNEEKRKKDEEKRQKDEEKRQKEDEKRRIDEEKQRLLDEQEMKKKKKASAFKSFFIKKDVPDNIDDTKKPTTLNNMNEMSFNCESIQNLDEQLSVQNCSSLYLKELQKKHTKLVCSRHQRILATNSDDLIIVEEGINSTVSMHHQTKLLQFRENYRPAYYGTWRKKSKLISSRNFLKKDHDLLDYEVDSDEEWEEEEPGESLSNSEGEGDDDAEPDDADEDDGFFVPHGYLSDDEYCKDDEDESPEDIKQKQLTRQRIWDEEMQRKFVPLNPTIIGCIWWNFSNESSSQHQHFTQYKIKCMFHTPIDLSENGLDMDEKAKVLKDNDKESVKKNSNYQPVPEEAMPDLIRLLHGNIHGIQKLLKEFIEYWSLQKQYSNVDGTPENRTENMKSAEISSENVSPKSDIDNRCRISKRQLELKVRSIASYEKRDDHPKLCWYVNHNTLATYNLTSLSVPNAWNWITLNIKTSNEKTIASPANPLVLPTIKQFTVPHSNLVQSSYLDLKPSNTSSENVSVACNEMQNSVKQSGIVKFMSIKATGQDERKLGKIDSIKKYIVIDEDNNMECNRTDTIINKNDVIIIEDDDDESDVILSLPKVAPKGQRTVLTMFKKN